MIGQELVGVGDVAASVHAPGLPQSQMVPNGVVVYGLGKGARGRDELFPWLGSSLQARDRFPEGVIQK